MGNSIEHNLSRLGGKSENLQLLRFLAAIGVIIFHSFSIVEGRGEGDPLYILSRGQVTTGLTSTSIFFLAGGFFIARGAERQRQAGTYFRARAKRIFPPLVFVNVMVILLGALFSELPAGMYFTSPGTWLYLLNCVFIPVHNLPGVFLHNPYLPTVNGSLWTLSVEFACYAACFFMCRWGMTSRRGYACTLPLAAAGFAALMFIGERYPVIEDVVFHCFVFYAGMGFWVFRDRIVQKWQYAAAALIWIFLSWMLGIGKLGYLLGLSYLLFYVVFHRRQVPSRAGRSGDFSYGMYLWGFPVQQAVQSVMGEAGTPLLNVLVSVPLAILLGMITYYAVERRFLKTAA